MFIQKFVSGGGTWGNSEIYYNNSVEWKVFWSIWLWCFIFSYLFNYKVLQNGKTYKCGFPDNSITKITNKLSDLKISYQIIYRGKNPFVKDFKKINQYSKYKLIALQKLDIKERMDALVEKVKSLNEEQAKKVMLELEKCLE